MRYILLVVAVFVFSLKSIGQEVVVIPKGKKVDLYNYHTLEIKPLFGDAKNQKDSEKALAVYVQERINSFSLEPGNKAYLSFEIHTDGSVQNVKVLYGKNEFFNQKAVEVISTLPRWKPASKDEGLVKSSYTIEVKN